VGSFGLLKTKPDFRSRNELADKALHRLGSRAFGEAAEEAFWLRQQVPVIGKPAEADTGQGRVIC
jgi:hypothetical protein